MMTSEKQVIFQSLEMIFKALLNNKKMDIEKVLSLYNEISKILAEGKNDNQ